MNNTKDEVYKAFGKTAEKAQVLELEASNAILSFIALFLLTDETTKEEKVELKKLSEKNDKKTLGNLLKQIKKIVEFDPQAETHINNALQKRNYLIHDFYKKHNFAIHSDNGREQMLKDLYEIFKSLEIGHTQLSTITDLLTKLDKRNNLSESEIKKLIDEGNSIDI